MEYYLDSRQFICLVCGHIWILISNKSITKKQHYNWLYNTIKEHLLIQMEGENNDM